MWSPITRHLVGPIHERLLARATFRYRRELEESQWYSPHELRDLQRIKLAALLTHAQAHTPFHRERMLKAGIEPGSGNPLEQLHDLPLLDKSQIRSAGESIIWQGVPGGVITSQTGGSSGEPLTFFFDKRRQAYDQAARMRSHRWFGVKFGDRELYLWGSPIELTQTDRLKRLRDRVYNHRLLSAFDLSPARLDKYLNEWDRFRPVCAFGYPSSLALFAAHAKRRGRQLDASKLQAIFVTGEVCLPHHRRIIADYFGVPVADGYGSREAGFIAHQCPLGQCHITAENVIVEIIDRGRPVSPGASGEIVITHLDAYAMPLIRYRTGDVGRLLPGRCACGRGLGMMDIVQGRTTDFLYLPDGTVKHALSIIYPLREIPGVRQFLVRQREDYGVTVDIVRDDGPVTVTKEAVRQRVLPVLGNAVSLSVELVNAIAPTGSGKHRYVISHAQPPADTGKESEAARA